jgi:hypothetical protein
LCHPRLQQWQQQRSSRNNNNAIFGIDNLILLGSTQTQHSTNDGGKRMGRMEANDSNGGRRQPMQEKLTQQQ